MRNKSTDSIIEYGLCALFTYQENTPAVVKQQGYSSSFGYSTNHLYWASPSLALPIPVIRLGSVQRTVEERIYVTRLVGSRKEVVNPLKGQSLGLSPLEKFSSA